MIQAITFFGYLPNYMALLKRSFISYMCIAIIHKNMLVSSGKRSTRASRALGLLSNMFSSKHAFRMSMEGHNITLAYYVM